MGGLLGLPTMGLQPWVGSSALTLPLAKHQLHWCFWKQKDPVLD